MTVVLKLWHLKTPLYIYIIKIIENALKITENFYVYGCSLSIFIILGMATGKC